ncbi:MAG: non-heme iron oxygenase ferredoxin subunit [Actinobacteria bacterium]|nr:non-heme iron oxygenase ferredoxin subunit [Actinomycetota bacterium]MCL5446163.1 non-heme iron oxygenase ferredoxin subunit [Actinomycetota bacterium]
MPKSIVVCKVDDIRTGQARRFFVLDRNISIIRIDDNFYAIGDTCSHQNYSLSEGTVMAEDLEIECPKHGSTFDLLTGEPRSLPATRPVPVYTVEVAGGEVKVVIE